MVGHFDWAREPLTIKQPAAARNATAMVKPAARTIFA